MRSLLLFVVLSLFPQTSALSSERSHRFFVLRHGETDANAAGVIQGSSDFSRLTDKGRQQALDAGKVVWSLIGPADTIYVSPLVRARDTLSLIQEQSIAASKSLPEASVWHDLRELDLHEWEGKDKKHLQMNDPAAYQHWKEGNAFDFEVSGCKPLVDVWDRAASVWERLRRENPNNSSTLLVCHGTFGQALLNTALGRDASHFRDIIIPNCGLMEIEWPVNSPTATTWRWHHPEPSERWTLSEWEARCP